MKVLKSKPATASVCPDGEYPGVLCGYECKWNVPGIATEFIHRREFGIRGTVQGTVVVANGEVTFKDRQGRNT